MSFVLREILLEPIRLLELDNKQLYQLTSQGRNTRLLASLTLDLRQKGISAGVPTNIWRHFESASMVYEKQKRDLEYDIGIVKRALDSVNEKLVLLKGAAYLTANIHVGRGRLISDIDIIVPKHRINLVEKALKTFGWDSGEVDAYDELYYRKWMHEVPPLGYSKRGTTLDLHHTILPPTAGSKLDASLLFDELLEVKPGVFTLSQRDMVIHSATHLFHEGEFDHGLRDLWDLDRMLRDFSESDSTFWDGLVSRARELDLLDSLFHSLTYTRQVFETPIPDSVIEHSGNWRRTMRKPMMDFLFLRAFRPQQADCKLPLTDLALHLLYIRSHYLRMPLYLLLPHLARKAWMGHIANDKKPIVEKETKGQ